MTSYADLTNETSFSGDAMKALIMLTETLEISASTVLTYMSNSIIGVDPKGTLITMPLVDGQILIGRTGQTPMASVLAGTLNQINIASAAGSIALSTPQDIAVTSAPTFAGLTLSALTKSSVLCLDATGAATAVTLSPTQVLMGVSGSILALRIRYSSTPHRAL
jgi:hypothetical protein